MTSFELVRGDVAERAVATGGFVERFDPVEHRGLQLSPIAGCAAGYDAGWHAEGVAKYDPLFAFLCRDGRTPISMTFDEIEGLVGALPPSASKHRPWWNNETAGGRHVQAAAWMNAGREVLEIDLVGRVVRFTAADDRHSS